MGDLFQGASLHLGALATAGVAHFLFKLVLFFFQAGL